MAAPQMCYDCLPHRKIKFDEYPNQPVKKETPFIYTGHCI